MLHCPTFCFRYILHICSIAFILQLFEYIFLIDGNEYIFVGSESGGSNLDGEVEQWDVSCTHFRCRHFFFSFFFFFNPMTVYFLL